MSKSKSNGSSKESIDGFKPSLDIKVKVDNYKLPAELQKLVENLLPEPQDVVTIKMNVHCAYANIVRHTLISMPIEVLTANLADVEIDCSMPNDYVILRLECIPIRQGLNITGSYAMKNTSNELMSITTDMLTLTSHGKKYKIEDTYELTKIRPGKSLKIDNIHVEKRMGGVGISVENILFREEAMNKYHLEFRTVGVYDGIETVRVVFNNLLERLTRLRDFIADAENNPSSDDYVYSRESETMEKIRISGERYGMGTLIANFAYMIDNTIGNIKPQIVDITEMKIDISWSHPSGLKFMLKVLNYLITYTDSLIKMIP